MKKISKIIIGFGVLISQASLSQSIQNDSLNGFNISNAAIKAHLNGCYDNEARIFIEKAKRNFIQLKYHLNTSPVSSLVSSRLSQGQTANAPCIDEDFEGLTTGTLSSTAWVAQMSNNTSASTVPCATNVITYTNNNTYALIVTTPVTDVYCNNVSHSPLGGTKILQLNRSNNNTIPSKVYQTFSVTSSNFIYNYAYKAVLDASGTHSCCEQPSLFFKFYDCLNNPIASINKTILSSNCINSNPDAAWWATINGIYQTPSWVVSSINFSAYIGSCVRVEVVVAGCMYTGHQGYVYYDALCSNSIITPSLISVSGNSTGNYSLCGQSVALYATGGLQNYLWQGPLNSGVSGSTLTNITASVSGVYTVSAMSGTNLITQTLNLNIYPNPTVAISSNALQFCYAANATLIANSSSQNTYTWSTGIISNSTIVTPTTSTVYSVLAKNNFGCTGSNTIALTILPNMGIPSTFAFQSSTIVCPNNTVILVTIGNGSIMWSNGATTSTTIVSPSITTIYSCMITDVNNCSQTTSIQISTYPSATAQITPANPTVCTSNQQATLSAYSPSVNGYFWSNSLGGSPIVYYTPSQNAVYSVTITDVNGCKASATTSVVVKPNPTVQIISSGLPYCEGQTVTITAQPSIASSYSWGAGLTTPTLGTSVFTVAISYFYSSYHLFVTHANGCQNTAMIQFYPIVQAQGHVEIFSSDSIICAGESLNLWETDFGTVQKIKWSTGDSVQSIYTNPYITTTYTIECIDNVGCKVFDTLTVFVDPCTGLKNQTFDNRTITISQSLSNEFISIQGYKSQNIQIINSLGQIISESILNEENNFTFKIYSLPKGIYYLRSEAKTQKFLIN